MAEQDLLFNLGSIIVAAVVFAMTLRLARVPSIVAYILAGLVVGPITGLVTVTETVEIISEFGIALLLFLVGLEISLEKIKDVGPVAVAAGIGQVVFTAAGGFGIAMLLGFDVMESIFISVALTFSSTVVVVKLLNEKDDLDELYGRIAVGIFLVQDIVVVFALTFLAGLAQPEDLELAAVAQSIGFAFAGMSVFLIVALLASKYFLPYLFGSVRSDNEATFIYSLAWCFLFVVSAYMLELSIEIGAFIAGISIAQLPYSHDLRRWVDPLVNFFIAVFFVTLGIQMELGAAGENWEAAVVLSLFVLIGNPLIFMIIISRFAYGEKTSFKTSVTVAQISEFSFIFASMGLASGLIDQSILSLIALVGLITIAISAYLILYNDELHEYLHNWGVLKIFGADQSDEEPEPSVLSDHIIVVGMNAMGRNLVRHLHRRGETVVALDVDRDKLEGLPGKTIQGNAAFASTLEAVRLANAKLLVSALNIEDTNNLLAYRTREADVPAAIHAFDGSVADDLQSLGVPYLIDSKFEGMNKMRNEIKGRRLTKK